jgi:hypothetical protein
MEYAWGGASYITGHDATKAIKQYVHVPAAGEYEPTQPNALFSGREAHSWP